MTATTATATEYTTSYDLTAPQMFYPATGTRTAELDRVRKTLTVFNGGLILVVLPVEDEVTPGEVWEMIANAEAPTTTEEIDGHEVETVDVADIKRGDQVVYTTREGRQGFSKATADAFRSYDVVGDKVTRWRDWVLELNGKYSRVAPGTTYRRAVDPAEVVRQERAAHRAMMADFNGITARMQARR